MRKLLLLSFVFITLTVFGQQQQHPVMPPPPTFIVPLQMGTDTVRNGIDTVRLAEDAISEMNETVADTNYTVMLTPKGNFGQLALMRVTRYYFIIKEQGGASPKEAFDYIVYAKQPRPWTPLQGNHPGR